MVCKGSVVALGFRLILTVIYTLYKIFSRPLCLTTYRKQVHSMKSYSRTGPDSRHTNLRCKRLRFRGAFIVSQSVPNGSSF